MVRGNLRKKSPFHIGKMRSSAFDRCSPMSSRYLLLSVAAIVLGTGGFVLTSALLAATFGVPLSRVLPIASLSIIPIALGQVLVVLGEMRGLLLKLRFKALAIAIATSGGTVLLLLEAVVAGFISQDHLALCIFAALAGSLLFSCIVYGLLLKRRSI